MTWFKVDDGLHSHRKVKSIPRRERAAAMGLWVLAGSWCADNLTDGRVPAYMLDELGCTTRSARSLVTAQLWLETDDGYQFHAWNEPGRQPARAEIEDSREAGRKRKADYRARMSQRDNDGTGDERASGEPRAGLGRASGGARAGFDIDRVENTDADPPNGRVGADPRSDQSMSQRDTTVCPVVVPAVSQGESGHPDPTRPDPTLVVPSELQTAGAAKPPPKPRRTRVQDDFHVTTGMRAWAAENAPGIDIDAETAQFLDYHAGRGTVAADWTRTWHTWMRNARKFNGGRTARSSPTDVHDLSTQDYSNVRI